MAFAQPDSLVISDQPVLGDAHVLQMDHGGVDARQLARVRLDLLRQQALQIAALQTRVEALEARTLSARWQQFLVWCRRLRRRIAPWT